MDQKKGFRRWLQGNVFYLGLSSLFSDMGHEMVTAILPFFLILELGAGPGVLGLIEGLSDGAASFTKSFSGYLIDKMGKVQNPLNTTSNVPKTLV
jgi:hypothetical protein